MAVGTLPSGVVTFVLTDIEGSTRLLRRLKDGYGEVLDRHVAIVREAWAERGGTLLNFRGDSCFGVFPDSASALAACAEAQRRLAAEPWPPEGDPRVRMGVHTGLGAPRDGDYVALAVHQAARVMSAAHGGQVLVSDATTADTAALGDLALRPVGRYRLRDFDEPVALYCLTGPGLEADFPAVRAMPVDGHNLAEPSTPLVGREDDLNAVGELLGPGRLVSLAGPGGVGKTRLAAAVGFEATSRWEGGVWFVDLAPMESAELIGPALADVLGVAPSAVDSWGAVLDDLHDRRVVVILDNCEHIAAGVAVLVAELLDRCPQAGVLATSREPLGIAREVLWRVHPLPAPTTAHTAEEALRAPAVRLFVDRAQAARPGFELRDEDVEPVVQLCRRLDGLPLALELAAAQTAVLSVPDLLAGINDRRRVLTTRQRGLPDRQRTIDAVMEWSYRLLTGDERALLRRLAVLRDGFSLEAAVVAGSDIDGADVLEVLWSLVDKSLVVADVVANATRYRQLETVRSYARRLADSEGETVPTAARLAGWWLDRLGPWHAMDAARSDEIRMELDNLRGLVPLVAVASEDRAQELACTIGRYYYAVRGPRDATGGLARYATELRASTPARVSLLATLALLYVHYGDIDAARRVLVQAEEAAAGAPEWDQVAVERAQGEVAIRAGDPAAAAGLARRTLAERELTPRARARMLNLLAIASYFSGDETAAEAAFAEELEVARTLGDEHLTAVAEGNVAELAMRRGDTVAAAGHQAAALELALALGAPVAVAESMILGARLVAEHDPDLAARLHAKGEAVLADTGHRLYDDDLRASEEMLERVRDELGKDGFHRASDEGRSLPLPAAAALARDALATVSAYSRPSPSREGCHGGAWADASGRPGME